LIGYEWDSHVSEDWHEDFMTGVLLGFLADPKPLQLMAIAKDYGEQAEDVKTAANHILIDEDRARLRHLYDGLFSEMSQLISPAERDELELRIQAMEFLAGRNISLEGITLSGTELREYIRLSKSYRDPVKEGFLGFTELSEGELAARNEAFESQVEKLLGPQRFAVYQLRQDTHYRESCAFAQQHHLSKTVGPSIYDLRRVTEQQAALVRADPTLSLDEQAAALTLLKSTTAGKFRSALGYDYNDYVDGPGRWIEQLDGKPKGKSP
jgi:hypothetical protein